MPLLFNTLLARLGMWPFVENSILAVQYEVDLAGLLEILS
jgi:hypothetical protein